MQPTNLSASLEELPGGLVQQLVELRVLETLADEDGPELVVGDAEVAVAQALRAHPGGVDAVVAVEVLLAAILARQPRGPRAVLALEVEQQQRALSHHRVARLGHPAAAQAVDDLGDAVEVDVDRRV